MNVEFGMRNAENEEAEHLMFIFPHSAFPLPHSKMPDTYHAILKPSKKVN